MKRLTSLLLCLIFIIGAIVPVTVSANETTPVDGLVEFEGYAARLVDYNGVRAQYLLDTKKLADLEENYDVTIGILIGMGVEDYEALTVDTAKNDLKFYENGAYVGKHEAEKDGKIKFVYAVTFEKEGSATAEKFLTELSFRAYVKLDEEVYYVDSTSERFGAAVSMADVALELAQLDDYKSNELFAGVANTLYPTLYVGYNAGKFENTSLILDFFSATPDSQFVTSANYTDTSKTAQNRFGAQPATYDPFITYRYADADPSKPTNAVTGGTATITSPWKFKNYYGRNYWIFDGGTKTGGSDPALYPDLTDEDALFEVIGVTEYYVTDTIKWTKMTYASSFGEGYFHMGLNSFLEFPEAVKAAKAAGGGSYTIQFVAQRAGGSGQWNAYIGFRPAISESGANVKFISTGTTKYYDQEISASLAGDIDAVNMYTFTFDREDTAAVGLAGYFNTTEWYNITAKEIANDGLYKIFESADANIYAIRVYDYVLSEGEIAQNNFADLAKFFSLDLAGFYSLDGTAKKAVYAATAAFTLSSDKADVQDAVTRAITGAYKLTYNENGDYVWAKPGVSFTLPVATSADKADMFLGYFTAEGVQVTDAKGAMTEGFTIAADTTVEAKFMNMYDSLYVGYNKDKATFENASLILDFFWATEETEIAKSASYTDIDAIAATRFGAQASTYDPFITYRYADANPSKPTNAVTGGTAPITSPWKFNNYYAEGYWKWENKGGTAMDGDGKSSYTGTSVPTTVTGVTEYYISDAGKWAKATYASNFGDGYFHMGKNSFLTFTSAQIEAKETGDGSYTIQFIAQRVGSGYFSSFVGDRVSINQSGKFIKFDGGYTSTSLTTYEDFVDTTTTFEGNIDNVNTYTFSFDRADLTAVTLAAYVNTNQAYSQTVAETKNEDSAKIFEGADANIYAIRVYNYALSADEIKQNNFADIAKFHELDVTEFVAADAAKKEAVYAAFASYTIATITAEDAETLLDDTLTGRVDVTYIIDGEETTIDGYIGESFTLPVLTKKGNIFLGYYADSVQVVGADGNSVAALTGPVTVEAKFEEIPYDSLYVGYNEGTFENTSLILDFFWATEETEIVKSTKYEDVNEYAGTRFAAQASTYTPFITYRYTDTNPNKPTNAVSGGTAPITTPWKFKNYSGTNHWKFDGGSNTVGSASQQTDGVDFTFTDTLADQYYTNGKFYVTNAERYAKMNYESSFGEGYFHMGKMSYLVIQEAQKAAKAATTDGSYTIQFIAQRVGNSSDWSTYLGQRYSISQPAEGQIKVSSNGTQYCKELTNKTNFDAVTSDAALGLDIDNVNTYTFSFDRSKVLIDKSAILGININGNQLANHNVYESSPEENAKIFENGDANIYAIRVYNYVLSADEIAQNNFADIAKYYTLDIADVLAADATAKKAVYAAFASYTIETITAKDAQELIATTLAQ